MQPSVRGKIAGRFECLGALVARKRFFTGVLPSVSGKCAGRCECRLAFIALVRPLARVRAQVDG